MKHRKPRNKHQKKNQTQLKVAASKAAAASAASPQTSSKLSSQTELSENAETARGSPETISTARDQQCQTEKGLQAATQANLTPNGHIDSGESAASNLKVAKSPPTAEAKKSPGSNGTTVVHSRDTTATTPEGNSQPKTVLGYTDKPSTSGGEATASFTRISETFAGAIVNWVVEQPRLYQYLCNLQRRIIDKILKNNAEQARQLLLLHNESPPSKEVVAPQKQQPKLQKRGGGGAASGAQKLENSKMENDTIVNSTSLEDVALSEMSDNRAQSIQSLHSVPDTPTGETDEQTFGLDDLQRRLERSNRCIESMQQEQQKLLRLHQDAKSNLAMLEKLRAAKARPLHGASESGGGVPHYDSIVDVGADMSMLVSRMNNLSEFIKNQNDMSQLLGGGGDGDDGGPDLAAEHDELMQKIAGLQQSRNDMSNLVKELNTLTENAERSAQEAKLRAAAEQEARSGSDDEEEEEDEEEDDDEEASRVTPTPQMLSPQPPPPPLASTNGGERVVPIEYSRVVPIQMAGNCPSTSNNKNKPISPEEDQQQKQVGDIEKTLSAIRAMLADVTRMEHVLDDGVEQRLQPPHESAGRDKTTPNNAGGGGGDEEALKRRIDIINGIANALSGQSQLYTEECERIQRLKADVGQHMKDAASAVQMGEDAIRRCTPTPTRMTKAGSESKESRESSQPQQQQQQEATDLKREYESRKRQFEAMCRSLNSNAVSEPAAEPKRDETQGRQSKPKEEDSPLGRQVHNVLRPEPTRGVGLRERRANYSAQSSKDTSQSTQRSTTSAEAEASVFDEDDDGGTVTPPPYDYEAGGYRRRPPEPAPYSPSKPLNHQAARRSNAGQSGRSANGSVKSSDSMPPAMNLITTNPYWNARQTSHSTRRESSSHRRQTPSGHEAGEPAQGFVAQPAFYGSGEAPGAATPLTAAQLSQTDPLMLQQFMHTQNVLLNSVFHFNQTSWHHQHEIDALKRKVKELEDKLNAVAKVAGPSSELNESIVAGSYRSESLPPPLGSYAASTSSQGIYNVNLMAGGRAQSEQPLNHLVASPSQAVAASATTSQQQQHSSAFAQYERLYTMPARLLYGSGGGAVGAGIYGDGQPPQASGPVAAQTPVVAGQPQAAAGPVPQAPPTPQQFVQLNNAVPQPPQQQQPPPAMVETLFNNETTPASPLGGPGPIFMHHHNNSIYQNNANLRSQNHYANNLQQHQHHQQSQQQQQQQHQHLANHNSSNNTLNNQVAPGNRTNNYWDNFRSYSRQNLLSTNSNKSNEEQQQQYMQQRQQSAGGQHTSHAHHTAAPAAAHPSHPAASLCSGHPQRGGHVEEYDPSNPGGSLIRPQHCPPPVYRPKPQTPHGATSLHNDWNNNNAAASTGSGNKPPRPPPCAAVTDAHHEPPFDMLYAAAATAGWNCNGGGAASSFGTEGLPAAASAYRRQDYKNVNIGNSPHYQRNKVPAKASCHPAPDHPDPASLPLHERSRALRNFFGDSERRRPPAEWEAATWPNGPAGELAAATRGRNYHRVSNLTERRTLANGPDDDTEAPMSDAEPAIYAELLRRRDSSSNSSCDTSAHRPERYNSYDTAPSTGLLPNEGLRRSLLPRPTTSNSLRGPLVARPRESYPKSGSGHNKLYNSMNNVKSGGEMEHLEQQLELAASAAATAATTLTLRHNNVLKPREGAAKAASNERRDSEQLELNSLRLTEKELTEQEAEEQQKSGDEAAASFLLLREPVKVVERPTVESNIDEDADEEKTSNSWKPDPVDILIGRIVRKLFSAEMAVYPVNDEFLREVSRLTVLTYHSYTSRAHIAYEPRLTEQTLYERLKAMKYPEQREAFDLWYHELLAELFRHKEAAPAEWTVTHNGLASTPPVSLIPPSKVDSLPMPPPDMVGDPPRDCPPEPVDPKEEVTAGGPQTAAQESPSRSASGAKPREPGNGRASGSGKKGKRSNNRR